IFGVWIVIRKSVIELAVERDDFAANLFQHLRREGAGRAVAASADHLEAPLKFRPAGEVRNIARRKILDEGVTAALARLEAAFEHDLLQARHLVRTESQRPG